MVSQTPTIISRHLTLSLGSRLQVRCVYARLRLQLRFCHTNIKNMQTFKLNTDIYMNTEIAISHSNMNINIKCRTGN